MAPTTGGAGDKGGGTITASADEGDVHPFALVTMKLYVPGARPETVVLIPVPLVIMPPGLRVSVQVPVGGNPFITTLPVATVHVGLVIVPTEGVAGFASTVRVYVATPAIQGVSKGLSVVTVMITIFPPSAATGV
jgi:hypothetical protein